MSRIVSVPEGGLTEIDKLKNRILQRAEQLYEQVPVTAVNFQTASVYSDSRPKWRSLQFHLRSFSCKSYNWERTDDRVSKNVLHLTFSFSKSGNITVTKLDENNIKLSVAFRRIAGAVINHATDTLALHYHGPAKVKVRDGDEWRTQLDHEIGIQPLSLRLMEGKYDLEVLKDTCMKNKHLKRALQVGIFSPKRYQMPVNNLKEDPAEQYPILVDPTLVRAVQLADLELLSRAKAENRGIKWVLKQFHGLDKMFQDLLNRRIACRQQRAAEE